MSLRTALRSVILIATFASVAPPVWANDAGRLQVDSDRTSPVVTLQAIFRKVDHNTMPCWCDKGFGAAAAPYVTPALISAVRPHLSP